MTLFTLNNDNLMKRTGKVAFVFAVILAIFTVVYYQFSHNVYSDYMTYLALIPFLAVCVPAFIFERLNLPLPGYYSYHLYLSGIAALTVSSGLRGIFDIAGNDSVYQVYLAAFGAVCTISGVVLYVIERIKGKGKGVNVEGIKEIGVREDVNVEGVKEIGVREDVNVEDASVKVVEE